VALGRSAGCRTVSQRYDAETINECDAWNLPENTNQPQRLRSCCPTTVSMAGKRLVSRLFDRYAAHRGAALTQAFLLGNFSAMWGMGKCASQILTVRGYDRCLAQYNDLWGFRRRAPVRELNAALRCESHDCPRSQTRGSPAVLCPNHAHAVAF
jgi:hypothetical protein